MKINKMQNNSIAAARFLVLVCSLMAMGSFPVSAQNMGRLFFTPAERADLDRLRAKYKPGEKIIEATKNDVVVEKEVEPIHLMVDGFVKRSSGPDTTWVNQEPRLVSKNSQNISVKQKMAQAPVVSVALPTGRKLKLKAGQSVDVGTGKVKEVFDEHENAASTSNKKKLAPIE